MTNEASPCDSEDGPELNTKINALIKELNLSGKELLALLRAANTIPEQYTSDSYRAWLEDKAPANPISKPRMLALLEMRKRLMSKGTSDAH